MLLDEDTQASVFFSNFFSPSTKTERADGTLTCTLCNILPFDKATISLEIAGTSQGLPEGCQTHSWKEEVHSLQHFSKNFQGVFSHMKGRDLIHSSL